MRLLLRPSEEVGFFCPPTSYPSKLSDVLPRRDFDCTTMRTDIVNEAKNVCLCEVIKRDPAPQQGQSCPLKYLAKTPLHWGFMSTGAQKESYLNERRLKRTTPTMTAVSNYIEG